MLHGAPWVYVHFHCHQNHHPNLAQGSLEVTRGHPKIAIFQPTHAGLKTVVLTSGAPYGPIRGPIRGRGDKSPGLPPLVRGCMSKW